MDYITAKQFLEQPEKVQKVFLDWWEPQKCDLFIWDIKGFNKLYLVDKYEEVNKNKVILPIQGHGIWNEKKQATPLLSETQLRHFIEEKTGYKLDTLYYLSSGYTIEFTKGELGTEDKFFNNLGHDLLQAYWQVACKIAEGD